VHLRHEIKELQRKLGVTTIMVTHDQEEALSMADRIVVMNHGVIEQVGTPTQVYRHPSTLFVADFIGETNKFDGRFQGARVHLPGLDLATDAPASAADVTAAIRPEDILPVPADAPPSANRLVAQVRDMEFLGSYWRTHLAVGQVPLIANFSMSAVRRFGIEAGNAQTIDIPAERVLIFPRAPA
jgi:iron(III) transport system ATP-binding protein